MHETSPPFGLNVIGYASANLGLGNTLRQYVKCFIARGDKVRVLDIDAGMDRSGFDRSLEAWTVPSTLDLPYAVNLLVFSATELPRLALSPLEGLNVNNRLNTAFVWWELTTLPQHWIDAAKLFDVLIAGSDFLYSVLSENIPGIPILRAPHPLQIPEHIQPNRERFGLPEKGLIVFSGFDPHSNVERKNPFAAITAFKLAFANNSDCHLAIKVNNPTGGENLGQADLDRLRTLIESDSRIHLIQESLPYHDLLSLYASCDVFVSLHRAEGLGLVPLEAMRLGKPVVATAWSGNMSYMNYRNACLVEFGFVPVGAGSPVYSHEALGIKGHWAEPNVHQAAAWLRKLAEDPLFRFQIGSKAAADANRYHEQACRSDFVDELKSIWESRDFLPKRDREALIHQARESKRDFEYEKSLNKMGEFERLKHKAKKKIDRHLLWRFRSAKT